MANKVTAKTNHLRGSFLKRKANNVRPMAALATMVMLPPGVAVAWLLARRQFPGRVLLETVVSLPLVLPPVATTIALGVFILLGIWILQVISRLFLFSASAANDAGARIAMVQTYLALANETPNTMAADRQVILHSLFGPDHSFGDQSGHQ